MRYYLHSDAYGSVVDVDADFVLYRTIFTKCYTAKIQIKVAIVAAVFYQQYGTWGRGMNPSQRKLVSQGDISCWLQGVITIIVLCCHHHIFGIVLYVTTTVLVPIMDTVHLLN